MQKRLFFTLLTINLLLSGCGLKGPLYQSPEKPPQSVASEKNESPTN